MRKLWVTLIASLTMVFAAAVPAAAATVYYRYVWNGGQWQLIQNYQPAAPTAPQQPRPSSSGAGQSAGTVQNLTADESYILQQVNAERAKAGLAPLQIDNRLVATARAKSRDMIDHNYFGHQSPTLGSPFDQMRNAGISYRAAGENIAGNSTAAGAMKAWMNSPGHRANILNGSFTRIGIGVVDGGPYGKMLTQQFIG